MNRAGLSVHVHGKYVYSTLARKKGKTVKEETAIEKAAICIMYIMYMYMYVHIHVYTYICVLEWS